MRNRLKDDWQERIKGFLPKPAKKNPDPLGLLEDPLKANMRKLRRLLKELKAIGKRSDD